MGGGNQAVLPPPIGPQGLSPRGRGKPNHPADQPAGYRSIPAWAGETVKSIVDSYDYGVYPRVGGGKEPNPPPSPPRHGLSPRGRGKLYPVDDYWVSVGSIPAWAGETGQADDPHTLRLVYPRVGGGNITSPFSMHIQEGLSPRGRGKRTGGRSGRGKEGSIPAWAGETPWNAGMIWPARVYPRVGGGNDLPARRRLT